MEEKQKWWNNNTTRKEIVEVIMEDDFSPNIFRQLSGSIGMDMWKTKGILGNLSEAISTYEKIMICNQQFSTLHNIQEVVEKFKKNGKILSLRELPFYGKCVSDLAKALNNIGISTKEDMKTILPILQVAVIEEVQKNQPAFTKMSFHVGFNLSDEVSSAEQRVLKQVPADALWNQVDKELDDLN